MGTRIECDVAVAQLQESPVIRVVSVSKWYRNRDSGDIGRVYVEARI